MKHLPSIALIWLLAGCASAPPLAPGIAGTFDLVSMDGGPLPSDDNVLEGVLELRENRAFTWRFTMQEIDEAGDLTLVPIVFEGRFAVSEAHASGFLIRLTRRDRGSYSSGNAEEIEGTLAGDTLSFTSEELTAVFRRRG